MMRTKARRATATASATKNPFNALALVSDSKTDSVYSTPYLPETNSEFYNANHEEYQARALKDCRLFEYQLLYRR